MSSAWAIAAVIMSLMPRTGESRAAYLGSAIAQVANGDADRGAVLAVTLIREGGLDVRVERCAIEGIDGLGSFGLNPKGWGRRVACGPLAGQAQTAMRALELAGWPDSHGRAFRGYLGAASERYHEVRSRLQLYSTVREMLACACSR